MIGQSRDGGSWHIVQTINFINRFLQTEMMLDQYINGSSGINSIRLFGLDYTKLVEEGVEEKKF